MTVTVPKDRPLDMRDQFAMAALPGVLAQWGALVATINGKNAMAELDEELAAERAYRYADAMLVARRT